VAVPTDPIGARRYLICLLHFGFDVDFGLINLALNENGYILPILAAVTILVSENCSKCGEYLVAAAQKLLAFVQLFQTEAVADFLDVVAQLMVHDPSPVEFECLLPSLLSLCADSIPRKRVAASLVHMINILGRCDELFERVLDKSMPLIMRFLEFPDWRDIGLNLFAALVTERASLPIDQVVLTPSRRYFDSATWTRIFSDPFFQ
jgi:hypothetical protein